MQVVAPDRYEKIRGPSARVLSAVRPRSAIHAYNKSMHGLQIWVALPKELEQMDPEFFHIDQAQLPAWETNGAQFRLIAGEAFGRRSPVPVYSKLFMIEIKSNTRQTIN